MYLDPNFDDTLNMPQQSDIVLYCNIDHYGPESPRAHADKLYGRLRLIRSVWEEHQNFPCLNLKL